MKNRIWIVGCLILVAATAYSLIEFGDLFGQAEKGSEILAAGEPEQGVRGVRPQKVASPEQAQSTGNRIAEHSIVKPSSPDTRTETRVVSVASSAGLRLDTVELLFEGRPTRVLTNAYDAKLGATLIDVPLAHGGMKIRAPGHVEKALVDDLQSIQLKPVALLELDGQQLRASVTSVVIPDDFGEQGQREFADYATWGFVDANRFALAVDVSPYMVAGGDDPALSFSLNLGSHQRLSVAWSLREGRRSALTLPRMADIGLLAPLSVELTTQENRAGAVFQLEAWRMLQPRALPVGEWTFADGKVQLRSRNLISNIKVDGNRAEIPELILGEQYRIAAYDDRGGSGGLEIQHSGNPISIETLSGLILTGTLKSTSRPLPSTIRAQWKLADKYDYSEEEPLRLSGKRPRWLGGEKTVEVGADGSIQVVVVRKGFGGQPPTRRSPPASVTLFLSSPGFKRLELDVIPEGEFEVELGPLTLSAQQPNLILDSHPFLEASDIAWSPVATSATSEPGYFEAETSIRLANGSFEVFLTPADADGLQNEYSFKSSLHGRIAESFPNPAPQAIVLFGKLAVSREYVPVGFELFGNSIIPHYRSVPVHPHAVTLDYRGTQPEVEIITTGWTWQGVPITVHSIHDDLATPRRIELEWFLPQETHSLWWTTESSGAMSWPPVTTENRQSEKLEFVVGG